MVDDESFGQQFSIIPGLIHSKPKYICYTTLGYTSYKNDNTPDHIEIKINATN